MVIKIVFPNLNPLINKNPCNPFSGDGSSFTSDTGDGVIFDKQ